MTEGHDSRFRRQRRAPDETSDAGVEVAVLTEAYVVTTTIATAHVTILTRR